MKLASFIVLLLVLGCKSENDAADSLRDYINYRFSAQQSKDELLDKTTGELFNEINKQNEGELLELVNKDIYKKHDFKINLKKCDSEKDPKSCYITYTLKLYKLDQNQRKYHVEVKKIARLLKEEGVWKIYRINDIKSYIQGRENIDFTTPGPTENPF